MCYVRFSLREILEPARRGDAHTNRVTIRLRAEEWILYYISRVGWTGVLGNSLRILLCKRHPWV